MYLNFDAIYLNFGAKFFEYILFEGCGGDWVGPSGPPGGLDIRAGEKFSAHPLRVCLKGGPEPLEKEIHENLGSKREDRFSNQNLPWGTVLNLGR